MGPLRRVDSSKLGANLEASRSPGRRDGHDAWIGAFSERKVPMRLDSAFLTCSALVALASGAAATQATTTRLSVSTAGVQGNFLSFEAFISADGRFVAFQSSATNLVGGDTNSAPDVFVRDIDGGVTERVSVATGGAQGNSSSVAPSITSDGRFVAFAGHSSNFLAGDANGVADIFVRGRQSGRIRGPVQRNARPRLERVPSGESRRARQPLEHRQQGLRPSMVPRSAGAEDDPLVQCGRADVSAVIWAPGRVFLSASNSAPAASFRVRVRDRRLGPLARILANRLDACPPCTSDGAERWGHAQDGTRRTAVLPCVSSTPNPGAASC
jgi:hypothetical protein